MHRRIADSTGQLHQISEEIKNRYYATNRCILFFHKDAVILNQLRIAEKEVMNENEIYIIMMKTLTEVYQIYKMTRSQWHLLTHANPGYKSCHLKNLITISNEGDFIMPIIDDNDKMMVIQSSSELIMQHDEEKIINLFQLDVLWSYNTSIMKRELYLFSNLRESFEEYIGCLFDFILIQSPLRKINHLSRDAWLEYIQSHVPHYSLMTFHFITIFMRYTVIPNDNIIYNRYNQRIVNQWLDFSVYLFQLQKMKLDVFINHLENHILWIEEESYNGWYRDWQKFRIPHKNDILNEDGNNIILSIRWLFELSLKKEEYKMNHRGCIIVKRLIFIEKIMPHIYRSTLKDLVYLLLHCVFYHRTIGMHDSVNGLILQKLSTESGWDGLYHYNLTVPGNYESPVMRAMVRYEERQFRNNRKSNGRLNTKLLHQSIGDIEDLAKIVPPCLKKAMEKDWCMHWDRLNMTKYCYDMGYNEDDIANYFSRHYKGDRSKKQVFDAYYKECLKEAPIDAVNQVSKSCSTIINFVFDKGNVIRCPYEEELHGQRRQRSDPTEIELIQSQCACKGGFKDKIIYSPLDYIKHKINLQNT